MANVPIRRNEDLLCGRLVAMPSTRTKTQLERILDNTRGFQNIISIDFPAMPDSIELARSADYYVNYNIVMPDGIHQYKGTKPLEIPISFRLHAMDSQYCKKGALTLLQLAARLHSFVLPISTFSGAFQIAPKADKPTSNDVSQVQANASQDTVFGVTGANNSKTGGIFSPVTCWLHLMWTAADQPGISCVGYVREVKVQFNGPWLRGPNKSFNLPTSADFSFVFIHRPGHNNSQATSTSQFPPTIAESGQAFADNVNSKLYNTRDLVYAANYQGLASDENNEVEPEPEQATTPAPTEPTPQNQTPIPANDPQIYQRID